MSVVIVKRGHIHKFTVGNDKLLCIGFYRKNGSITPLIMFAMLFI
jgi:hypothetical protein